MAGVPWWVIVSAGNTAVIQSAAKPTGYSSVKGPYPTKAAANAAAGSSGGSAGAVAGATAGAGAAAGGCGPQAIYSALLSAGFSTPQAIGAMANAIAESSLNPEASAMDSNGAYSNGLWQFNEASYPSSGSLVTGNCAADITAQVGFLKSVISGQALNGTTGAEVAGNFAANFERCAGCSQGSTAANGWSTRVANAAKVESWVTSGNWPTASSGISGSGGSGGSSATTTSYATGTCAMPLSLPLLGSFCPLSKAQARGLIGGLLMAGAAVLAIPGLVILAAAGLSATGAGQAAGQVIAGTTPAGRAARFALKPTNVSNDASQPPVLPAGKGAPKPTT